MESARVGTVGMGTIARTHLEVLAERSDVDLVFTVDPHAPAPVFRGTTPAHYRDLDSALAAHQPDLVVIATPADSHADLAASVLTGSDARVLVEKPLVLAPASLERLGELDGVRDRLFTAHHFAFSPEVEWAAELVAAHPEWGPVTGITRRSTTRTCSRVSRRSRPTSRRGPIRGSTSSPCWPGWWR